MIELHLFFPHPPETLTGVGPAKIPLQRHAGKIGLKRAMNFFILAEKSAF
jgi:hypothetical protein